MQQAKSVNTGPSRNSDMFAGQGLAPGKAQAPGLAPGKNQGPEHVPLHMGVDAEVLEKLVR